MRFCRQCGAELKDNANFCAKCGAKWEEEMTPEPEEIKPDEKQLKSDAKQLKSDAKPPQSTEHEQNSLKGILISEGTDVLLYLGLLCASVLPGVIESLIMFTTKHSMASSLVLIIELLGMIAGLVILSLYLSTLDGRRRSWDRVIKAGTSILWLYLLGDLMLRLLEVLESFAFTNFIEMFWIYYIVFAALVFITLAAMSRILSRTVNRLLVGHPGKLMRRPKLFWRTLLLLGAALFLIPDIVIILFSGEFIPLPLSYAGTVTAWVVTVYIQAIVLKLAIQGIIRTADNNAAKEEAAGHKLTKIMPAVAAGLVVAVLVYDLISSVLYTPLDAIESNIQSDMNYGAYYMASGDIEMAMKMYDSAYTKTSAWLAFVDEDSNELPRIHRENPEDEQIEYLMALKHYTSRDIEKVIFEDKDTSEWYHLLLDVYREQESNEVNPVPLSEAQEIIRKDLLNICIASESIINTSITVVDIEGQEKKITQALNPYLEFIDQYAVYKILNEISHNGGIDAGIMNRLLTFAEENKGDLLSQYLAYSAGRGFLYDGAPHYKRTAEAAMRFRNLFLDQLDEEIDLDDLTIDINMEVAGALMDLHDYANAVVYLEEAGALGAGANVRLLTAQCYESLENYDKSLEMASLAVKEDPKDYRALDLAMISALKVGKVTESMNYAVSLLEHMSTLDGAEYLLIDADMYIYVQYLTVQDETRWTPQMKYKVYPDLDEDQQKILDESPLLDHYMQALYYTFGGRDFDMAWSHTQTLMEAMPDSAQIQYLAGTIHFNKKEFDKAAEYYTASLDRDDMAPSTWYALANAYDAMEDYQKAYECTLEVAKLLQYNDHAVDLYGVQVHNQHMMKSLEGKIGQGGK